MEISFKEFLELSSYVKKMYSRDGKVFYSTYEEMQENYINHGDILLPETCLIENRTYYVIKL